MEEIVCGRCRGVGLSCSCFGFGVTHALVGWWGCGAVEGSGLVKGMDGWMGVFALGEGGMG